jgi:hypothetical protein
MAREIKQLGRRRHSALGDPELSDSIQTQHWQQWERESKLELAAREVTGTVD